MSWDVYFQGFRDGDASVGGGDVMRRILEPFVIHSEPDQAFLEVQYGDGTADVHLSTNHMTANHIEGHDPWQLLVEGATAAGWVILPVGCPTCITDEAQRAHLPDFLGDEAVLVTSGDMVVSVIESSGQ